MDSEWIQKNRAQIEQSIRTKYEKVAGSPEGLFKYPTGRAGLNALHYPPELVNLLPEAVTASFCGVGNPFSLGPLKASESILDIGCGAGVDTLLAAMMVGAAGKAVGIDMVAEMVKRAKSNQKKTRFTNVIFLETSAETLPFSDERFDVLISNGVFNLIPDKYKALTEAFRVLKPGGRLMIADQVLAGTPDPDVKARLAGWFR